MQDRISGRPLSLQSGRAIVGIQMRPGTEGRTQVGKHLDRVAQFAFSFKGWIFPKNLERAAKSLEDSLVVTPDFEHVLSLSSEGNEHDRTCQ
jgi:hypothetical protein